MGFLDGLFRALAPANRSEASASAIAATLYEGDQTLEVVGESHYQDTLWRIVGGRGRERVRYQTIAVLAPELENPYDRNAVQVLIGGELVGYLSREDAAAYRPGLVRLIGNSVDGRVALEAAICGGGNRADGLGRLGVFLHHNPTDFGLA